MKRLNLKFDMNKIYLGTVKDILKYVLNSFLMKRQRKFGLLIKNILLMKLLMHPLKIL